MAFHSQLMLMLAVVLASAGALCCAQEALCSLEAGSTPYSLADIGTLESGTADFPGIIALPSPYTEAYINFCEAATTPCGDGVFICVTETDGANPYALCDSEPAGDFITPASPQLGAWFSCTSPDGLFITNGIVSSVFWGSHEPDSAPCYHLADAFLLCVHGAVFRCGPPSNVDGVGFDSLYTNASSGLPATYDFAVPLFLYCENSGTPGVPI
jgi:hypothetical protein